MTQMHADTSESIKQEALQKMIINHLLQTAYYTKRRVTCDADFKQFRVFFDSQFQFFEGKHTEWLNSMRPDFESVCTPQAIDDRFKALVEIFYGKLESHAPKAEPSKRRVIDYNQLTNKMIKEAQQYNHYTYKQKASAKAVEPSKKREVKEIRKK